MRYYKPYEDELRASVKLAVCPNGSSYQSNARRWLNVVMSDKRCQIFPNVEQNSIDFKLKKVRSYKKYENLFSKYEPSIDVINFSNCLVDWTNLYDVVPLPSIDCRNTRRELGLVNPSEEYMEAYSWLLTECVRAGNWKSVHVNKKSQSGAPFFIKDKEYRTLMALYAIENVEQLADYLLRGDYQASQEVFHVIPVFTDGIRVQADNIKRNERGELSSKTRRFADVDYLRSDGKEGRIIEYTAKTEFYEGVPLFQVRTRKMYGFSSPLNHVLATMHNYLYEGYKQTVKIAEYNGPDSVIRRLEHLVNSIGSPEVNKRNLDLLALDKASFDLTMSPELNDLEERIIAKHFKAPLSELYKLSLRAPTIIRSYRKDVKDVMITKPLCAGKTLLEEPNFSSLQSGHAFVSLKGKWKGVADICDKVIRYMKDETWSKYHLHKQMRSVEYLDLFKALVNDSIQGITIFSFGDDTLVASIIPGWIDDFRTFCKNDRQRVHDDQVEEHPVFLGYYYNRNLTVHKNIGKLIESLNGDERGWKSKTNPQLGLYSKIEEYKRIGNPYVEEVLHIESQAYDDLGFNLFNYIDEGRFHATLTPIDMEFINKPEVIYYKYAEDQISEELLKSEFETIEADFISYFLNNYLER